VPGSSAIAYTDPHPYQAAVRPAQVEILVTAKGDFHAQLRRTELPRLWVQRGRENLPRIANSAASADRPPIFFLTGSHQAPISHGGREFGFGEIVVSGSGLTHHHRTEGPCHWGTLSVTRDTLASAGHALLGRDLIDRSATNYLRPPLPEMFRLLRLHQTVEQLASNGADILAQLEPARALEQALLHAMVACLREPAAVQTSWGVLRHVAIIARFEELLAANYDRPLHLPEICAAIGASERTLRVSCMEHFGMGPVRYLWLRRMHLARRSLIQTAPGTATVTDIATANGFWELGRFAVEYRALFGEAPSASLRRPAQEIRTSKNSPFTFADSEYA
jgi:AraC-like DNA-binding protein